MSKILFEKEYDGESIVDLYRDILEATDENFNDELLNIPTDQYGFQKGTFKVTLEWTPD